MLAVLVGGGGRGAPQQRGGTGEYKKKRAPGSGSREGRDAPHAAGRELGRGGARIDASQLQTALTVAERKFAADRERRHPSSGAQDVDEATAADILQKVASDGDTFDRNDFLHALVLWRSTARTRDRCVRNESACCALA